MILWIPNFQGWKYGIDIIVKIKEQLSDVNWIKTDETQDMQELYAISDMYIRPTRHDGKPRINVECKLNGIPNIYSEDGILAQSASSKKSTW